MTETDNMIAVGVPALAAVAYMIRPTRWSMILLAITSFAALAFILLQTGPRARTIAVTGADQSESFRAGVFALYHAIKQRHDLVLLHGIILTMALVLGEWRRRKK